jgi:hypothetical protein
MGLSINSDKTVVCAFGRFQPPTRGHDRIVAQMQRLAASKQADAALFLSQTAQKTTDPLPYREKVAFARLAWGTVVQDVAHVRTPVAMLQYLASKGYTDVVYVAGDDRAKVFRELFTKYNGTEYTFKSITVVSAGKRVATARGVEGVSASKLREYAVRGKVQSFLANTPTQLTKATRMKLYYSVRKGLGILPEEAPALVGTRT